MKKTILVFLLFLLISISAYGASIYKYLNTGGGGVLAPNLTDIQVGDISYTTATVTWTTDITSTNNKVYCGTSSPATVQCGSTDTNDTAHSVALSSLTQNTLYYYHICSEANSQTSCSPDTTFSTAATPPINVSAWHIDANGTDATSGYTLTLTNLTSADVAGQTCLNSGYAFNGTTSLAYGTGTNLNTLSAWSYSAVVYPTGAGNSAYPRIWSRETSAGNDAAFFYINTQTMAWAVAVNDGNGTQHVTTAANNTVVYNNQYAVTVSYDDGGDKKVHIYACTPAPCNPAEVSYASQPALTGLTIATDSNAIYWGNRVAGDRAFVGDLDELYTDNYAVNSTTRNTRGQACDAGPGGGGGPVFYISPSGNNSYDGTTNCTGTCSGNHGAWLTFAKAFPSGCVAAGTCPLQPGATLKLMDGNYASGTTGLPAINCSTTGNAKKGTSSQHITIEADHERQAYLYSNGGHALTIAYCQYWDIIGLHGESADNNNIRGGSAGDVFYIMPGNSYLQIKRNIGAKANRYGNNHIFEVYQELNSNILFEENECYYYHRECFMIYDSSYVTLRRNYGNSRNYADLPNPGYVSSNTTTGDALIALYAGNNTTGHNIAENNISENDNWATTLTAAQTASNYYGNIGINNLTASFRIDSRYNTGLSPSGAIASNGYYENNVSVNSTQGFAWGGQQNCSMVNSTVLSKSTSSYGVDFYRDSDNSTMPSISATATNVLSVGASSGIGYGVSNTATWTINYSASYGNLTNYSPCNGNVTNNLGGGSCAAYDPNLGLTCTASNTPCVGSGTNQCMVYIPAANTRLKGVGASGADVGANLIYRYQGEAGAAISLSATKLWNQSTGQFPCGATVTGLNNGDGSTVATQACLNVNKRLNVGWNGCAIP